MPDKQSPNEHALIVVLGSPNSENGQLYHIAIERCELALKLYHQNTGAKLLLTGGFGAHFNVTAKPHAFYLQKYLLERGIPESAFVEFALSSNTLEDASLSKPIILNRLGWEISGSVISRCSFTKACFLGSQSHNKTTGDCFVVQNAPRNDSAGGFCGQTLNSEFNKIIIVTSDYHYPRAKFIFEREFSDTSVEFSFYTSDTDAEKCEIDLESLKKHEKIALRAMHSV